MIASTARHRSRQIQATVSLHQLFQILIFGLLEKKIVEMLGILVTALINSYSKASGYARTNVYHEKCIAWGY